jgi:hypothetical protein
VAERLIVHGITVEAWAARYDIEPTTVPCHACGAPKTTSMPFVQGALRGLASPPCMCGDDSRAPYCLVRDPKHGDLLDGDLLR